MKDIPAGSAPKRFTLPDASLLHDVAVHSRTLDREQTALSDAISSYVIRRVTHQSGPVATLIDTLTKQGTALFPEAPSPWGGHARPTTPPSPSSPADTSDSDDDQVSTGAGSAGPSAPATDCPAPTNDAPAPADDAPAPMDLPGIDPDITVDTWTYDNLPKDDITQIAAIRGSITGQAFRAASSALLLAYCLPRFAERVRTEEFTTAHALAVTTICQGVSMRHLPALDAYLASRRADVTCETLRRTLKQKIMVLQPPEERAKDAAQRRRVEITNFGDGTSCLTLIGPTLDLNACYTRTRAFATAINKNQISAFGLPAGTIIEDERGIDALTFDILTRTIPTVSTRVTTIDPVTRIPVTHDEPFVPDESGCRLGGRSSGGLSSGTDGDPVRSSTGEATGPNGQTAPTTGQTAPTTGQHCFPALDEVEPEVISRDLVLTMPTGPWWLSHQAAVIGTVPFMTAYGASQLPGHLPDGSPIDADTARRLVGYSSTLYRVLTDPATGTPLDAKARAYRIPRELRTTIAAKWTMCTAPGCTREAEKAELDHVIPFDHEHPDRGGTTAFDNIHPLCKPHHAQKTARTISVVMPESGIVSYEFAQGLRTTVHAPDRPIDAEHALQWWDLARQKARPDWAKGVLLPQSPPSSPSSTETTGDPSADGGPAPVAGDESVLTASTTPYHPHEPYDPEWGRLDATEYLTIATRAAARYFATRTERTRTGTSVGRLHTNPSWHGTNPAGPETSRSSGSTTGTFDTEAPGGTSATAATGATGSVEQPPCTDPTPPFTDPTAPLQDRHGEFIRWRTRTQRPEYDDREPQVTRTRGIDIIDHDPFIIHCALGTRDDGSPLFRIASDLRRAHIQNRSFNHRKYSNERNPVDWHESDDDQPPF